MNRLACRHDPVAPLEARLWYRPCRSSFEGFIRLDPIETHHLRFLSIEKSVYRRGSGSTSRKGCQLRRVGRVCGTAASAHARDQGARRSRWTCGWPTSRGDRAMSPGTPACVVLLLFSDIGGPWRAVLVCSALSWTGSAPAAAGDSPRRGRPLRGNDHANSTPDHVPQSFPFQG